MAHAMVLQGTLGSFMAYSQIGGSPVAQAPSASGQPPGSYTPAQSKDVSSTTQTGDEKTGTGYGVKGSQNTGLAPQQAGKLGNAGMRGDG